MRPEPRTRGGYLFGTFTGVFTPSTLTILGVIMYLRLPWVLGSVGLSRRAVLALVLSGDRPRAGRRGRSAIEQHLDTHDVPALVKVETDVTVADGLIALVTTYGFGPLIPNTVLPGQAKTPDDPIRHAELLWTAQHRRRNVVIVHEGEELPDLEQAHRLDIWWAGERRNIGLMLALAFLLRKDVVWRDAAIVIWRIVEAEDEVVAANAQLEELLAGTRFPAQVRTLPHAGDPFEAVARQSRQANLIFLGMRAREADEPLEQYAEYYAELVRKTEGLPPTVLVTAGDDVDLHRLFASL